MKANSEKVKEDWEMPLLPKGYWNSRGATYVTKERLAEAEGDMLSPYQRALADMDASAKRSASETK